MAIQLQVRRGTGAQNNAFTGASAELSVNTDNNSIRVHDGVTAGGTELARSNQIDSVLAKSVAGGVDVTLAAGEYANSNHEYSGILTANINVIVPATVHNFTAENLTTGAFTLTVKTAAGTGILIPQGKLLQLYCNGVNVEDSTSAKANDVDVARLAGSASQTFSVALAAASSDAMRADQSKSDIIAVDASVAGNALTLTIKAGSVIQFRSTTLTTGIPVTRFVPADISLVISSGSTLGTVNAVQSDIAIIASDNAGTVEVAAVNISGGTDLSETSLISTTAEGSVGAADSATVFYSTTARTNVAYRVVGIVRSTQATAGTWATNPSLVQGAGGNALTSMMSFGYGQTLQNVTASRTLATTYYNTTGKPIYVSVNGTAGAAGYYFAATTEGLSYISSPSYGATGVDISFPVRPGASYNVSNQGGAITMTQWLETR